MENVLSLIPNSISSRFSRKVPVLLQIVWLMEQYIEENSKLVQSCSQDNYPVLEAEYDRLTKLGLGNTKNARIILEKMRSVSETVQTHRDAENLILFIKGLRKHFGETTMLIGSEQFKGLLKKYKLDTGLLQEYTGIIPDKNIREIEAVIGKIPKFSYAYLLNKPLYGNYLWKVTDCINETSSSRSASIFNLFLHWIEEKNGLVMSDIDRPRWDDCISLDDLVKYNTDMPRDLRHFEYSNLIKMKGVLLNQRSLFIACPPSQLEKQTIKITKKAIDPIVFQYSPYGIVIHSIWGEEAEDKVFEEYKKVNKLLSLEE